MSLRTKVDQWCAGVIEAGWLAALVIAPLFFNVFSSRVFEPDKISLIRTIALMMLVAWLIKIANGGAIFEPAWARNRSPAETPTQAESARLLWRNPFFIPVAMLVVAYLISTLFSLAPAVSWFGSYQRLQGTYSFLSYLTIGLLTTAHLRSPEQIRRLQHVVVVTSVPIAIYGIIQHMELDPLPWGGDTTRRITANAGNAIFLGAYLIMALFFTFERIFSSFAALLRTDENAPKGTDLLTALTGGFYLFAVLVQALAIVWTQSRGPWLGALFGAYLFVLLVFMALRPRRYMMLTGIWVGLGVAGVALIFAMNTLPVFEGLRDVPYLGRLTQLLDQESTTAQVRTLIWQGASEMVTPHEPLLRPDGEADALNAVRPLVGYGPEAMWVAFNRFYPAALSQVEARNASPDRSHNETWDSLVVTGLLGFVAYMALFLAIFYWAMRWLGLLVNKRDTWLFFTFLLASGALLSAIFYIYDGGQTRYFGVAFPAGLMFGLLLYIMAAAFLHPDYRPDRADLPRQLLIIALFTAILAHFVEIHFGIAIAATRTYFWVFTAMLTVLGLRWAQPQPLAVAVEEEPEAEPEPVASVKGKKGSKVVARPAARRRAQPLPWTPLTVFTDALIFVTMVFLYTTNARGATNGLGALWGAFTTRVEGGAQISSPAILILLLFTWLVMLVLGLAGEALSRREMPPLRWWLQALLVHGVIVWGAWLVYGAIQGSRVAALEVPSGLSTTEQLSLQLDQVAGHFAFFTAMLIVWMVVTATGLAWRALSDRAVPVGRRPLVAVAAGLVGGALLFAIVSFVNVALVRADIIYKQGQQFDGQANWVNSIELYRRALDVRESEDHYMLFLGRALLEAAKVAEAQRGGDFPEQATMADVMALTPERTTLFGRQELLRAAEVVLRNAQRVNPLNTDHTANLARLYRTWSDLTDDAAQKQEMLDRSIAQYEAAVRLSPQAAHLWNERGNAHLARQEPELAEEAYRQSLALDPYYVQTYLLLTDLLEGQGRFDEAAAVAQGGVELIEARSGAASTLQLLSVLGVNQSRAGDTAAAIDAMQQMLAADPNNITALRNIALLQRDAGDLEAAAAAIEQALGATAADQTDQLLDLQTVAAEIYQLQANAAPNAYNPLLRLARLYQQQGNVALALQYAQQADALAPADAQNETDQMLAELGG